MGNKDKKVKIAYKFITDDWKSKNGNITWKLNKWNKHDREIELCNSGFHACKKPIDTLEYIYGDKFVIVEYKGKVIDGDDKFVCSEMKVIKEIPIIVLKRFAIAQAKCCLKDYEEQYLNDTRVSDCIKAAEDYLDNKITLEELNRFESAAWSAAESAWSAVESARSAAESAWSAARSAESARSAWFAVESARSAWFAVESARSAAESAWSAARSAESARSAWSAAWSAARSAARSAANELLLRLINSEANKK